MAPKPKTRRSPKAPGRAKKPSRSAKPRTRKPKAPVTPSSPPQTPAPAPVAPAVSTSPAAEGPVTVGEGYGIRFLARLLDSIYVTILGFFSGFFGGVTLAIMEAAGWVQPGWDQNLKGFDPAILAGSLVAVFFYHWSSEWAAGTTVGKLICQMRVVMKDGRPCTFKGSLVRNLAYYLDSFFFGLVGLNSMSKSRLNQRYGDVWGKTVVVKATAEPATAKHTGLQMVMGIAIGSAFNMLFMFVTIILRSLA
jgi:uncharacterized RDD family membrane protein YckC